MERLAGNDRDEGSDKLFSMPPVLTSSEVIITIYDSLFKSTIRHHAPNNNAYPNYAPSIVLTSLLRDRQ